MSAAVLKLSSSRAATAARAEVYGKLTSFMLLRNKVVAEADAKRRSGPKKAAAKKARKK